MFTPENIKYLQSSAYSLENVIFSKEIQIS